MRRGNSALRRAGTSTNGSFLMVPRSAYVRIPPREGPTSHSCEKGIIMKPTLKWYAHRATLFLGSLAAFAFVINGAKRW